MTFHILLIYLVECSYFVTGNLRQLLNRDYTEASGHLLIEYSTPFRKLSTRFYEFRLTTDRISFQLILRKHRGFYEHGTYDNVQFYFENNVSDVIKTIRASSPIELTVGHVTGDKDISGIGIVIDRTFTGYLYDRYGDEVTISHGESVVRTGTSSPHYILRRKSDISRNEKFSCETKATHHNQFYEIDDEAVIDSNEE